MAHVTMLAVTVFVFCPHFIVLEGFQWTAVQQSKDVISVVAGSSVTLPCEYELTPEEEQHAKDFHMITWTREVPRGSGNWLGLAMKSSLLGTKVLDDDSTRITLVNGTALALSGVTETDYTRYQCAFQSSFFATPSVIQLNVQFKPRATGLAVSEERVVQGTSFTLTCTARANPAPVYNFYSGDKLLEKSNSGVYSVASAKLEDSGRFTCVPSNFLGEGPVATVQLNVQAEDSTKFPYWAYGAIGGGLLVILVIASIVFVCRRKKGAGNEQPKNRPPREVSDVREAHTNPAVYRNGTSGVGLRYAGSLDDVRSNAYVIPGRHLTSLPDISENVPMTHAGYGGSLNDVRSSAYITPGRQFTSLSDIRENVPNNFRNSTDSVVDSQLAAGSVLQLIHNGKDDTKL